MSSAPNYENIREGGPEGIRKPMEVTKATYQVFKELDLTVTSASETLNPDQAAASYITVTGATGALNVIFPVCQAGNTVVVSNVNAHAAAVTFKVTGKTGIAVAANKRAILMHDGLSGDIVRITADT